MVSAAYNHRTEKLLWLKEVGGKENVPLDGRFIVTPNHQSFLDDWIPSSIIVPSS